MKLASSLLLLAAVHTAAGQTADVFRNPTAGFEVTKPAGWHYATAEQNAANLKATKLNDEEFKGAMMKFASTPMVAMTKFQEPYADLNPSLKVNIRPLGPLKGQPPVEIVKIVLPQLERAFKDFKLAKPPAEVRVGGLAAAYVQIHYTMQTSDGGSFPTASELWIVPRGDFFFMLGAGTRQDEKSGSRKEIADIVASIKITP